MSDLDALAAAMAQSRAVGAKVMRALEHPWRGMDELMANAEQCPFCGKWRPAGQPCPRCR